MMHAFTIPGPPVGKERPRVTGKRTFTPPRTRAYEEWTRLHARNARVQPLEGPLKVTVTWAKQVPASWSKKRKAAALAGVYVTGTPDLDNVVKAVSDALNGIAYADDALVAVLHASRVYVTGESYVRIEISQLLGGQDD